MANTTTSNDGPAPERRLLPARDPTPEGEPEVSQGPPFIAALHRLTESRSVYTMSETPSGIEIVRMKGRTPCFRAIASTGETPALSVRSSSRRQTDEFLNDITRHLPDYTDFETLGIKIERDLGCYMIDFVEKLAEQYGPENLYMINGEFGDMPGEHAYLFVAFHKAEDQHAWMNLYIMGDQSDGSTRQVALNVNRFTGDARIQEEFGRLLKTHLESSIPGLEVSLTFTTQ